VKISVYAVCFNEEKMLPHFLNYYGAFAARIVIYDNMSTDRSREIIASYPNTEIIAFETQGELQELTLTEIRSNCWKGDDADYAMVCDIDEFLYAGDLPAFLRANPDYDIFQAVGFDMVSWAFPTDVARSLIDQVQRGVPDASYSKMLILKPRQVVEMNYAPGAHSADPVGHSPLRIYRSVEHGGTLKLLHYKYLSFAYVHRRHGALKGRLGKEFREHGFGLHYQYSQLRHLRRFLKRYLRARNRVR
jgi:glycosyltransferase involved in cell wall biosynthesis